MYRILILVVALLGVGGCSARLESAGEAAIAGAQNAHDKQLVLGRLAVCGTSLRALGDEYRDDPYKVWAILVLCDQDDLARDLVRFMGE